MKKPIERYKAASGLNILQLHYSADPDKNPANAKGKAWRDREAESWIGGGINSVDWRREMEIDAKAGVGELVFPTIDFDKLTVAPISFPAETLYYAGFDMGTRNPTSFNVYAYTPEKKIYSVWEYYQKEQSVNRIAKYLWQHCPYMKHLEWIAADPSIWNDNQSRKDEFTSYGRMFQEEVEEEYRIYNLMPSHSRSDRTAIAKFILLAEQSRIFFYEGCFNQKSEFRNLKYPDDKYRQRNPTETIVDKHNHAWDNFKYFLLSHPDFAQIDKKLKPGTMGWLHKKEEERKMMEEGDGNYYEWF